MVDTYIISASAQGELESAAEWYNEQLDGLGVEFADTIYEAAEHLTHYPEAYSSKRGKLREFVIKRFPFIIVYEYMTSQNLINILHVFHTSRNPKLKYKRKKD